MADSDGELGLLKSRHPCFVFFIASCLIPAPRPADAVGPPASTKRLQQARSQLLKLMKKVLKRDISFPQKLSLVYTSP